MGDTAEHYILATGGRDIERLRLLHEVYGPGTEALFGRGALRWDAGNRDRLRQR